MAQNVNIETIRLKLQDFGKLKSVSGAFNKLNKSLAFTPKQINEAIKSITKFDQRTKGANNTSVRSVATYNKQIAALRELQNNVAIGGKAYRAFGAEADRLRAQLEALTNTQKKQRGFFGRIGKGLGKGGRAALGGAVGRFLPPSAQIGGIAGFAEGGLKGGIKGAGIGLAVDAVAGGIQFAREAAISASEVQKLEIALKGVTKDQKTFEKGLQIIANTSKRLNVPIAASTKQFTTLSASVLGAGGTIEQAKVVFEGVSNSIKATGGNAEDVQSAIRAMSQIFGKGKVSAEELQGQLGERLAGAVVKFAEANGSSLQKLQKDLRDGTVGLDQVIKFAQKLNIDFADTAERVANSSADAGQRLKTQLQNIQIEVGKTIIPLGAAFQQQFSDIIDGISKSQGSLTTLVVTLKTLGVFLFATVELVRLLTRGLLDLAAVLGNLALFELSVGKGGIGGQQFTKSTKLLQESFGKTAEQFEVNMALIRKIFAENNLAIGSTTTSDTEKDGLPSLTEDQSKKAQQILDKYAESVKNVNLQIANSFVNTFNKLEDSLVEFVQTGTLNFKKLARSIINDITRIFIRSQIIAPLTGGLGNIFGIGGGKQKVIDQTLKSPGVLGALEIEAGRNRNALGNVIANNKIVPYAKGGLIERPTIFPLADGAALAGEAGVEAILPLRRGKNGKLGVEANGGGIGNIVVNVDASGSSVEGNSQQSAQLGKMLGSVIQAELIKQKRPGGLLS